MILWPQVAVQATQIYMTPDVTQTPTWPQEVAQTLTSMWSLVATQAIDIHTDPWYGRIIDPNMVLGNSLGPDVTMALGSSMGLSDQPGMVEAWLSDTNMAPDGNPDLRHLLGRQC